MKDVERGNTLLGWANREEQSWHWKSTDTDNIVL